MSNVKSQLNLKNLVHVVEKRKSKSGAEVECLVIPIEANKIFVGEKGFYLNLIGFELADEKKNQNQTHLIKQSFSKEYLDALTDEQKKQLPILGNHYIVDQTISVPVKRDGITQNFVEEEILDMVNEQEDDLPF